MRVAVTYRLQETRETGALHLGYVQFPFDGMFVTSVTRRSCTLQKLSLMAVVYPKLLSSHLADGSLRPTFGLWRLRKEVLLLWDAEV